MIRRPPRSTLSLHDALPISPRRPALGAGRLEQPQRLEPADELRARCGRGVGDPHRSEEHTSELQSLAYLVCRLLLEKKNGSGVELQRTRLTQRDVPPREQVD